MNEFNPSADFIEIIMMRIEHDTKVETPLSRLPWIKTVLFGTGATMAGIIGIINIIRLFASVYMPVACN